MPNSLITIDRIVGDRRTPLAAKLYQSGAAVVLTGSTVLFHMVAANSDIKVDEADATIDGATTGEVSYAPTAADVDTPGIFYGWFIVVGSDSKRDTFPSDGRKYQIVFHER